MSKAYGLFAHLAPFNGSVGLMVCGACGEPIDPKTQDFREAKKSCPLEDWRYVTHHRGCLSDDAIFVAAEKVRDVQQKRTATLLTEAKAFRDKWDGCASQLEVGQPALSCSGRGDDGFWSATYHHECRKAEEALNKLHDIGWHDDWLVLCDDMEWEDWPWLIEEFPVVAGRMKITTERFNEVQAERDAVTKAWRAIDAERRAKTGGAA